MLNLKLPHWAQVLVALLIVVVAWATKEQADGALNLPQWGLTLLALAGVILGTLSGSALVSKQGAASSAAAPPPRGFGRMRLVLALAVVGMVGAALLGAARQRSVIVDVPTYETAAAERGYTTISIHTPAGCAWFNANKPAVVADAAQIASCVLSQFFQGGTDPAAIASACIPATLADVEQVLLSLIAYYDAPTPTPAQVDAGAPPVAGLTHSSPPRGVLASVTIALPQSITMADVARLHRVHASAKAGL